MSIKSDLRKIEDGRTDLQNFFSDKWGVTWAECLIILRAIDNRKKFSPSEENIMAGIIHRMWNELDHRRGKKK